jgi:HAD superfamily hydrolase (TIGR01490 family)
MTVCHDGSVSGHAAAFFDLDKTILAKSSSLAFARPLYDGGLIGRTDVLKSAYAQLVYLTSGADHDQMERMRVYLSELSRGWDVDQVRAVVAETLDGIVDPIVYQEAIKLIAEHQAAGRDVIIISSSGTEIVEPIGARLGVNKAIGTQMVIEDGKYTGDILFYAYGPGKADAMRQLAADEGYDLDASYAYSDSYTDLPMLEVVGHPFAVNPDEQLRRVARERVWPVLEFAKPVAMQRTVSKEQKTAAGAAGAAAAVALGLAWYARYRRGR